MKRYQQSDPNVPVPDYIVLVWDSMGHKHMNQDEVINVLNEQIQVIEILKQEIANTQVILEMLSEKLKGWS